MLVGVYAVLFAIAVLLVGIPNRGLLPWVVLLFAGPGLVLLAILLWVRRTEAESMELRSSGMVFRWPSGKQATLALSGGVTVRLLDQSLRVAKPRFQGEVFPAFIAFHSKSADGISLPREAFLALQNDLIERGATLVSKRSVFLRPGVIIWEYRV